MRNWRRIAICCLLTLSSVGLVGCPFGDCCDNPFAPGERTTITHFDTDGFPTRIECLCIVK